jgi:hypothetical protein
LQTVCSQERIGLLSSLMPAKMFLGDKGYDADWFIREALAERGTGTCIPARRGRNHGPSMTPDCIANGVVSRPVMNDAANCSFRQSASPQWSSFGYES